MKFKSYLIIVMLAIAISSGLSLAQEISLYGSLGYGVGRGGNEFDYSASYDEDYELTSIENHYLNIGKGMKLEGGFQFNLDSNFGLRIGGGYATLYPALESELDFKDQTNPDTDEYKASIYQLHCIGILKYKKTNISPYAGLGGGLFFANMNREGTMYLIQSSFDPVTFQINYNEIKYEDKVEYRFKSTFGLIGIFGIETLINANFSFFAEVNLQQVAFTIKEWEVVKAKEGGQNVLDEIDVDEYKDGNQAVLKFEKDSKNNETPWIMQGSNLGIRMGIKINL